MIYSIDKSKFGITESQIEKKDGQKKYNLKLHKNDLNFLKKLADSQKVSINQLIDTLIYTQLVDFLKNRNPDEAVLFIEAADIINDHNPEESLFLDVLGDLHGLKYEAINPGLQWNFRSDNFRYAAEVLAKKDLYTDFHCNSFPSKNKLKNLKNGEFK